jgi:hypothetical protein
MPALAQQRCLNHLAREAVARCVECRQFFCRECIAEHDDCVVCAACLKKLSAPKKKQTRRRWNVWLATQLAAGLFFAWIFFYVTGRLLLALPDKFHADNLWEAGLRQALEYRTNE